MSITQTAHSFDFIPTITKSGKVTEAAARTAAVLNAASLQAVTGAALTGKGAVAKLARGALSQDALTLPAFRNMPVQDWQGGYWQDLLTLLAATYPGNIPQARGKVGCFALLDAAAAQAERRFNLADFGSKARESADKLRASIADDISMVGHFAGYQQQATTARRDEVLAQYRAALITEADAVTALEATRLPTDAARAMIEATTADAGETAEA